VKRSFPVLVLLLISVALLTAASSLPNTTITLVQGLDPSMSVGEVQTVQVQVTSDQEFLLAQAMPSFAYPGKGVVAVQGGDHAGRGTSAMLEVTFEAKGSTANMEGGAAPVYVVVGVRYPGGYVKAEQYVFYVSVP
jgi:hypothetical protein